jgi:small subunit ribosomal protein S13
MEEKSQTKSFLKVWNTALEGELPISRAMLKIKGIGINFAKILCKTLKLDPTIKAGDLTDPQARSLEEAIKNPDNLPAYILNHQRDFETGKNEQLINADLKLRKENDIKRLKRVRAYKGIRHQNKLPLRGQRTKAHFRSGGKSTGIKKVRKTGK